MKRPKLKRSKYGAVKTTVDGFIFDSKKEARRYVILKLQLKCKDISDLRLQVRFDLTPTIWINPDTKELSLTKVNKKYVCYQKLTFYKADFTYIDRNEVFVVEDVKGEKTATYKRKCKQMKLLYNIIILET